MRISTPTAQLSPATLQVSSSPLFGLGFKKGKKNDPPTDGFELTPEAVKAKAHAVDCDNLRLGIETLLAQINAGQAEVLDVRGFETQLAPTRYVQPKTANYHFSPCAVIRVNDTDGGSKYYTLHQFLGKSYHLDSYDGKQPTLEYWKEGKTHHNKSLHYSEYLAGFRLKTLTTKIEYMDYSKGASAQPYIVKRVNKLTDEEQALAQKVDELFTALTNLCQPKWDERTVRLKLEEEMAEQAPLIAADEATQAAKDKPVEL